MDWYLSIDLLAIETEVSNRQKEHHYQADGNQMQVRMRKPAEPEKELIISDSAVGCWLAPY